MNKRIKLIRKKLNMSQGSFAKKLGVTAAGISKIENGKRNLTEQMLLMICKEFHINEKWLRYGEGDIFKQELPDNIERLAERYQLDELDQRIIYEYISLDDKRRRIIKEYILKVAYGSSTTTNNIPSILVDDKIRGDIPICAEGPIRNNLL